MVKKIDVTGQRFERLVVQYEEIQTSRHRKVSCICDCGNTIIVQLGNLRSGHTKSCGCFNTFEEAVAAREAAELKYYGFVKQ